MRDLSILATKIVAALDGSEAKSSADDRAAIVTSVVQDHTASMIAGLADVRGCRSFLIDIGFSRGAAKKLAPAFKSLLPIGDGDGEVEVEVEVEAAAANLLSEIKAARAALAGARG